MSDKTDTLAYVLQLPASVQDATDMLTDYLELFEDDEELYDVLYELQDCLLEVSNLGNRVGQIMRKRSRDNQTVASAE